MGADTRPAERRIAELQRSLRTLEAKPHNVKVNIEPSTVAKAKGELSSLEAQLGGIGIAGVSAKAGIVGAVIGLSTFAVKSAADMETMHQQLNSVVKSGKDADKVFKDLKTF